MSTGPRRGRITVDWVLATESQAPVHLEDDATKAENNSDSIHPPRQHRRLTKSSQSSPRKKARRSLAHILLAIKHSSSLNRIFISPANAPAAGRRPKNSCNSRIDESAIHGPKITQAKCESKGFSFCESWLIFRTPTLPSLLVCKDEPKTASRYQNYPVVQQPRPVTLSPEKLQNGQKPMSRMPLVRTPSYEIAEKRAAALRGGYQQQQQRQRQQLQEQPQQQSQEILQVRATQGSRPLLKANVRQFNTESDLQRILRNTAQRLNDGSPSPVRQNSNPKPTRGPNRATRHTRTPASRASPVKPRPGMTSAEYRLNYQLGILNQDHGPGRP